MNATTSVPDVPVSNRVRLQLRERISLAVAAGAQSVAFTPCNRLAHSLAFDLRRDSPGIGVHFLSATDPPEEVAALCHIESLCLVVCVDAGKVGVLSWLNGLEWKSWPTLVFAGMAHQRRTAARVGGLNEPGHAASHAKGYGLVKAHLFEALRALRSRRQRGAIVELGTFRGGTLKLIQRMLSALEFHGPELIGLDTFAGFPPRRSLLDLCSLAKFEDCRLEQIETDLQRRGIGIIRGDIVETVKQLSSRTLLLSFVDTDNYTPIAAALPLCFERTVDGGFVIFDHFYTSERYANTIGERVAAEEFFGPRDDYFHLTGTGVFMKLPRQ